MASALDDLEAEIRMLLNAHRRLTARQPENPLLLHVTVHEDGQGLDYQQSFVDRYCKADEHRIHAMAKYTAELEAACSPSGFSR